MSVTLKWMPLTFLGNNLCTSFEKKCSVSHEDVIERKHFPRYWPFVQGIHRSPVNSPHKGQWRGVLMFSLICAWINGWVKNREAGNWRRHRIHYDVIVMQIVGVCLHSKCREVLRDLTDFEYCRLVANIHRSHYMLTSSNGNIFLVTTHLCGEFTGHRWISLTKVSDAELWCLISYWFWILSPVNSPHKVSDAELWCLISLICAWINGWAHNREAGDLRHHRIHYDIIVVQIVDVCLHSKCREVLRGLTDFEYCRLVASIHYSYWRHQMETFSSLLAICAGIRRSPVNSPHKGQWRRALMFFFDLSLNKRLSKQSWGWWFETPPRPLWRHCDK